MVMRLPFLYKTQKFKAKDNISWCNFCERSVSKDLTKVEQGETCAVYDFSVDHSSIKKEDVLNIFIFIDI